MAKGKLEIQVVWPNGPRTMQPSPAAPSGGTSPPPQAQTPPVTQPPATQPPSAPSAVRGSSPDPGKAAPSSAPATTAPSPVSSERPPWQQFHAMPPHLNYAGTEDTPKPAVAPDEPEPSPEPPPAIKQPEDSGIREPMASQGPPKEDASALVPSQPLDSPPEVSTPVEPPAEQPPAETPLSPEVPQQEAPSAVSAPPADLPVPVPVVIVEDKVGRKSRPEPKAKQEEEAVDPFAALGDLGSTLGKVLLGGGSGGNVFASFAGNFKSLMTSFEKVMGTMNPATADVPSEEDVVETGFEMSEEREDRRDVSHANRELADMICECLAKKSCECEGTSSDVAGDRGRDEGGMPDVSAVGMDPRDPEMRDFIVKQYGEGVADNLFQAAMSAPKGTAVPPVRGGTAAAGGAARGAAAGGATRAAAGAAGTASAGGAAGAGAAAGGTAGLIAAAAPIAAVAAAIGAVVMIGRKATKEFGLMGAALTAVSPAASLAVLGIKKYIDVLTEQNDQLAKYSADLAAATSMSDVRQQMAEMRRAERLGPDLAELENIKSRFETAIYDINTNLMDMAIKLLRPITAMVDMFTRGLEMFAGFSGWWMETWSEWAAWWAGRTEDEEKHRQRAEEHWKNMTDALRGDDEPDQFSDPFMDAFLNAEANAIANVGFNPVGGGLNPGGAP